MAREVMRRRATDNPYLHRDFHGALSAGIEYLDRRYGEDAVREYLRQFTARYYAPVVTDVKRRGLAALKEHFERIYEREGGRLRATLTGDDLLLEIAECPAVAHMRGHGYPVARLFYETTRTVNEALCEGTPFAFEMLECDERTGRCAARFYRRRP